MPADAHFDRVDTPRTAQPVYFYASELLRKRFSSDRWTNVEPGTFTVIYKPPGAARSRS